MITMRPGETFNESTELVDAVTSRSTRRLTMSGAYNNTPTYHLNAAFSADSRYLVIGSARQGGSAVLRAEVETGELTVLAVTDGIGGAGSLHTGGDLGPFAVGSAGGGFDGNGMALIQASGWVAACLGRSLRVYNVETLEERILIEDLGPEYRFGNPIGSIDGKKVIVTRVPAHPDLVAGLLRPTRAYRQACVEVWGGMPTTYLQVDIASGEVVEVFHETVLGSHHIQPCPADPDLWLIDRDAPPDFWAGGDERRSTRAWLLNAKSKELTELAPLDEYGFQVHTNWNVRGDRVIYHGPSSRGGQYIGAIDRNGEVLWERWFPAPYYGHVSTHTRAEAIVTDGLLTPDLLTAIYYEDRDATGTPRIEVLARHATQWGSPPGQYSHPHCHMSPDGRWLSYNRSENGRCDVYLVRAG